MTAKQEIVGHVNDVELVVGVKLPQSVQHFHLDEGLVMKTVHNGNDNGKCGFI